MSPEEICQALRAKFGGAITDTVLESPRPYAVVAPDRWVEVATFLRDAPDLGFNFLRCISAIDLLAEDQLACVYDLMAVPESGATQVIKVPHVIAVRVVTGRKNPSIPSVAGVWPAADWHEREAFDMMGIDFPGHPHLTRILCPEDWEGHPLRKDYVYPLEYHGIPGTTEHELMSPRH